MYKIYYLKCPIENIPRYIGMTKQDPKIRFYNHLVSEKFSKNPRKHRWIKKLKDNNLLPEMIILIDGLTKEKAEEFEIKLIAEARRLYPGRIINICNGGNTPSMTPEIRDKIRNTLLKNNRWKGRKHSEESKLKMSISRKGKPMHTEESRKKMSIARKGKTKSEEHKKKISDSNKGKIISEDARKKMSDSAKKRNLGKYHSEEQKKKIAEKNRARGRKIIIYDFQTETKIVFETLSDAKEIINPKTIHQYLNKNKLYKKRYKIYDFENIPSSI